MESVRVAEPAPAVRRCVACGYDLFGLGDEPRCPECGLLNIPEGFRQQVWKLVDANTVFFSNPFNPFKKRPPGWWWALDRPGDLKRAIIVAVCCIVAASLLIAGALALDSAAICVVEESHSLIHCTPNDVDPAACKFIGSQWSTHINTSGLFPPRLVSSADHQYRLNTSDVRRSGVRWSTQSYFDINWSLRFVAPLSIVWLGVFLAWFAPASVGTWTQIRKGLPRFARAPRTILAASLYETHRLVYVASLIVSLVVFNVFIKFGSAANWPAGESLQQRTLAGCAVVLVIYSVSGWIGPLRSDFTQQLIRSRLHALRVLMMYALVIPSLFAFAVLSLIWLYFLEG